MNRKEQVAICRKCLNRKMDKHQGILCGLTSEKAAFTNECIDFKRDYSIADRPVMEEGDDDFFAPEKKGIKAGAKGGLVMMVIAIVWFFGAYEAGIIFYYPPILFLFGLFAFLKGLLTGNFTGEKNG